jgi:hypothetical protein
MITNQADFEAVLEEVAGLLDRPFERDDSERLAVLMQALEGYRPVMDVPADAEGPDAERRRQLQHQVNAFQKRLRKEHHLMGDLGVRFGLYQDAEKEEGVDLNGRAGTYPGTPQA